MVWPTNTKAFNYPTAIDRTPDGCHPIKDELFSPGSTLSNLDMALLWRRMSWVFRTSTIRMLIGGIGLDVFPVFTGNLWAIQGLNILNVEMQTIFFNLHLSPQEDMALLPGLNLRGKMGPCHHALCAVFHLVINIPICSRTISQMAMKLLKLPHTNHHPCTHMHQSNI